MNTFLTLLATFYMCDAMAEDGPLEHATHLRCTAAFETLKIGFLNDTEREALGDVGFARGAQAHQAVRRFAEWEHDNDALVARFKDEAKAVAVSMGSRDDTCR